MISLQRILLPTVPFFGRQKLQILSKKLSNILSFYIFVISNMRHFHLISMLYSFWFVAKSVESSWLTVRLTMRVHSTFKMLLLNYSLMSIMVAIKYSLELWWKLALIHVGVTKKQPFYSLKHDFVKFYQISSKINIFVSGVVFCQKQNSL